MRLARLLKILTAIQANPNLGAGDLAERCEMSVRTAYRDLDALKAAGVPIYCDKGYKLSPGFFLPPLKFTVNEAVALIVGAGAFIKQKGTPYSRPADEALAKVMAALPPELRELILESSENMLFDARPVIDYRLHRDTFDRLERARVGEQTVEIVYKSFGGTNAKRRRVDPYALLYRESRWYLIAFCHLRSQVKIFRIDRISDLAVTGETYQVPVGFSVESYLGNAWRIMRGPSARVRIRFKGKAADLVNESKYHPTQELTPDGNDHVIMSADVGDPMEMLPWIMGFGADAEVLEPLELRRSIADNATAIAKNYFSAD